MATAPGTCDIEAPLHTSDSRGIDTTNIYARNGSEYKLLWLSDPRLSTPINKIKITDWQCGINILRQNSQDVKDVDKWTFIDNRTGFQIMIPDRNEITAILVSDEILYPLSGINKIVGYIKSTIYKNEIDSTKWAYFDYIEIHPDLGQGAGLCMPMVAKMMEIYMSQGIFSFKIYNASRMANSARKCYNSAADLATVIYYQKNNIGSRYAIDGTSPDDWWPSPDQWKEDNINTWEDITPGKTGYETYFFNLGDPVRPVPYSALAPESWIKTWIKTNVKDQKRVIKKYNDRGLRLHYGIIRPDYTVARISLQGDGLCIYRDIDKNTYKLSPRWKYDKKDKMWVNPLGVKHDMDGRTYVTTSKGLQRRHGLQSPYKWIYDSEARVWYNKSKRIFHKIISYPGYHRLPSGASPCTFTLASGAIYQHEQGWGYDHNTETWVNYRTNNIHYSDPELQGAVNRGWSWWGEQCMWVNRRRQRFHYYHGEEDDCNK